MRTFLATHESHNGENSRGGQLGDEDRKKCVKRTLWILEMTSLPFYQVFSGLWCDAIPPLALFFFSRHILGSLKESRSICFRTTCRFNRHGGSLLVPANVVDPHSGGNRQAWSRDILLFLWFMYAAVGSVSLLTVLELVSGSRSGDDSMRPSPVRFEFSQRLFSIIQRYMFSAGARDLERSLCRLFCQGA